MFYIEDSQNRILGYTPNKSGLWQKHQLFWPDGTGLKNIICNDKIWNRGPKAHITFHTLRSIRPLYKMANLIEYYYSKIDKPFKIKYISNEEYKKYQKGC